MFLSTIIPTIARPVLARAVNSVLEQNFSVADFEVIVVNDSGQPLPPAGWQQSERVTIITTQRRERIFARNSGAAVARGEFLHFLDDDDWLLPGALHSFWELTRRSTADWLYGAAQLVDRQGRPIIQLRHELNGNCFSQIMAGEWVPLQTSLIRSTSFFAIGGFAPLVMVSQDVDLCRRIALHGDLAGTPDLVACIGMGSEGSSTDYQNLAFYSRRARERILDEPRVFSRMRASAGASEWHGRIARTYLTSAIWNLQRRRLFTALSRGAYGLAGVALAGRHLLSPAYWGAVARAYDSVAFRKGFEEARVEQPLSSPQPPVS